MNVDWMTGTVEPLVGDSRPIATKNWTETALDQADLFEASIRQMGLSDATVGRVLDVRSQVASTVGDLDARRRELSEAPVRHLNTPEELRLLETQHQSALDRLATALKGVRCQVEEETEAFVRIPLFVLASPAVEGCTVTFSQDKHRCGGSARKMEMSRWSSRR